MRRATFAFVAALVLAAPAAPGLVDIDNPPAGVFEDEWYAIMLNSRKSGHMHSTMERVRGPDGRDVIRTKTMMMMVAGRAESTLTVTSQQETEETLDGRPLSFTNTMRLGALPSVMKGTFRDGKVHISHQQFGQQTVEQVYELPPDAVMAWGAYREQIRRGLKPGTRYELKLYDAGVSPSRVTPALMEVLERETIDLFGRKVEAVRTRQTLRLQGLLGAGSTIESDTWMTDAGTAVKLRMTMLNIPVELLACTRSVALSKNDPAELMTQTLIEAGRRIDRHRASRLTCRLTWSGGKGRAAAAEIPETDMQRIVRRDAEGVVLEISRRSAAEPATRPATLPDDQRQRYLEASVTLNHRDPKIRALAAEAVGDEKDPWRIADRLRRFVTDYVRTRDLSVGFATASEVARSREGDCTEHGVLLAALGRAAGIPSRVVTGVLYVEEFAGREHVFGGHMWTQFWIDDRWVDLDAAFRQTEVDPTHIALGVSPAGDTGVADMVNSIWLNMDGLKIEILDLQ